MLEITIVPVTPLQQNCTVLRCTETGRGAVVDPGGDLDRIRQVVADRRIKLEKILVTHGHLDHVGGVAELVQETGLPIEGPHPDDRFWIEQLPMQAEMFGFPPLESFEPDRWLQQGDTVQVGTATLDVLHCPGHTPGHVVFFDANSRTAIVGDVLFQGSIGRTDFPRGDHATLIASIRERLWPLGRDVRFVPGHGPTSTFGAEREANAFVADRVFA